VSFHDVYIQGDWSTQSGEPPVPRTVGDVISCWEKTHRPVVEKKQSFIKRLWNSFWDAVAINF